MAASPPASDAAFKQQIAELQAKTKQLEAALAAIAPSPAASPVAAMNSSSQVTPAPAMPAMTPSGAPGAMGMGDMGGMPMNPQDNKPMPSAGMGGMMTGMMGMMNQMMGKGAMPAASPGMPMSPPATPPSALPGFSGVSHSYHIGSTGFFLEHAQHIGLSTDQQAALTKLKEQALLPRQALIAK